MSGNLFRQVLLTVKPLTAFLDLLYPKGSRYFSLLFICIFVFNYLFIYSFFFYREHVDQNASTKRKGLLWSRNQL